MNYFEQLNAINCNDFTEKKSNLTYLSWAHAWKELKKIYPRSYYTVYQNDLEWNYFTDNRYAWVKTGVTVVFDNGEEIEHIEYLPVMDYKNKSIPLELVTSFDVNKAIQRSLTKAVARHGLGLYIYAGEDLPDESDGSVLERKKANMEKQELNAELSKPISEAQINTIKELMIEKGRDIDKMLAHYGIKSLEEMTAAMYGDCVKILTGKK